MPFSRRTLLLGGTGLALAGCGGGGDIPAPGLLIRLRPRVAIRWAARSRALSGPASARLAEISVRSLVLTELTASFSAFRDYGTAAEHTKIYELTTDIPVGRVELTVRFYDYLDSDNGATRTLVAVAQQQVELTAPDGLLPDVVVEGLVASVTLAPGQVFPVGSYSNLALSARDRAGNLLALSPGSVAVEILEGSGTVTTLTPASALSFGILYGVAEGTARVRVRVNDQLSAPETITVSRVVPLGSGSSLTGLNTYQLVWDARRQRIWFADTATSISNTLQSLDLATRTLSTPYVIQGGGLSDLVLTPDGSSVYAYASAINTILRITLNDGIVRERILPPANSQGSRPLFTPLPGAPNRVLVGWFNGDPDVWVYDGETPRPISLRGVLATPDTYITLNTLSCNDDGTVAFIGGVTDGLRAEIGAEGFVGKTQKTASGRYNQGQLVDGFGRIYEATTGKLLSSLTPSYGSNPLLKVLVNHAYLTVSDFYNGTNSTKLSVITPETLTEQTSLTLPRLLPNFADFSTPVSVNASDIRSACNWGEHGLALLLTTNNGSGLLRLLLYDTVPGL
ncbi:hypothetical protein [Armatimonas rosea]|uniref:Uncharacterized protein n=1 Tax=Armatimonas rosea TaxID=685828 RepID=A0A7W9W7D4_ARMRO|nr:hypothetical protein [Armatimonas rosea]MBB6051106.1 hypothetical protein [Armatimonas rosea]